MAAHSDGVDEPGSYLDCKSESPSLHHEKEKKETLSSDISQETDSYNKGISDMMSQFCQLQLNSPQRHLKTNLKMQNYQWKFVQKSAEFMDFITEELQKLNCTIHHVSVSDNVIEIDFKQSNSTDDQPLLHAISDIFDRISKKVACRTIQDNPSLISFETFVAKFEHSLDSCKAIAVKGPQTIMVVAKENDIDTVCDEANKTMQLLTDHRGVTESGSNVSLTKNFPVTIIQLEEKQILFLNKCEKGLHYVTQQLQSLAEDCEIDVESGFLSFVHVDEHDIEKLKSKLSELIVTFKLEPGLHRYVFSIQELDQLLRERLCSECDMFMVSKEETSHDVIVLCTDSVHAAVENEIKTITDGITEDELVMPMKEQEYFKKSGRWNELYNMQDSDLQQKVYFEEITDGDTFTLKIIGNRNKVRNIKTKVKQWLEPQTYSQTYLVSAIKVKLLRKREKAQQYIKQELEKIHTEFHLQNGENSVTLTSNTFENLEQGYKKFEKLICEERKYLKQYPTNQILTLNEIKTKVESKIPEKLIIEYLWSSKQLLLCGTDDIMPKAMEMLNEITDVCCFQKTLVMDKFRGVCFHTEIHEMIDNLHDQIESCRVSMEEENDKYVFYLIGPRCDILDNEEKIDNFFHSLDKLRFVELIDIPDSVCQLLKQSEHAKDYVTAHLPSRIEFDIENKLIKSTTEVKSHSEVKSLFDSLFRSDTLLLENELIHLRDVNELTDVLTDILNDVYKLEKYKGKFLISCPAADRLHICGTSDIFDDCLTTIKEICKYTDQTELGPITKMEFLKQKLDHLKSDLPQQVRILLKTDSDLLRIIILGPKAEIEKAKNQFNLVDLECQPKQENKVVKLSTLKVRFLKYKDTALSYILKTLESKQTKCQFDVEKGIIIFTECKSAEESEQMLDEIIVEHEENISEKPIKKVLGLSKIAERIEEKFGEGKLLVIPNDDKNSLLFIGTHDVMPNVMDEINKYLNSYEEKKIEFSPDIYWQVKCEVQDISTSFDEDTLIIKPFTDDAKKGFIIIGITDICTDVFQRMENLFITIPLSPLKLKYCQEFTDIIDEKFKEKQIQYWFDFDKGVIVHNEDSELQKAKTLLDEIISEHCENICTQPITKLLGIEKAVEKIKNKLQDEKVLVSCNNEDLLVVGTTSIISSVLEKIYKLIENYEQRKVTLCNTARIFHELHQISVKYDRESLSMKQLTSCETTVEYLITGVKVICRNVCDKLENIFVTLSISHTKLAFLKSSVTAQDRVKESLNDRGIEHILEIDPEVILHIEASKAEEAKTIVNDIIIEQREDMSSYSIRRLYELDQISGEHEKKYENQLSVTASNNPDNAVKAIEFPARKREFLKYSQKAKTNIAFNLQKLNISVPNFDTEKLFLIGSEADKVMQVFDAVITEHRISISSEPLMKILGLTQIAKSIEEHFEKDNLLVFPNVTEDSLLLVGISDNMPHVLKQINNFFGKFEERQIAISRDLFKKKPNLVDEIENISFLYDTEVLKINPVSGCEPTVTFQIVGKTDDCTVVGGEIEKMFQSNPPNPLILVDTSIKKTKRDFSDQTEQCEQSETTVELFVPVNDLAVSKLSTDEGEALSSRIKKNNECDIEAHQISGIVTEEIYSWYSSNGFQVIAVKGKLWNMQADVLVYPVDEELRTVEGLIPSHFLAAGTFSESLRSFLNMEKNIKESSFKFVDVENKRILIVRMPKETTEKKNVLKCILRKTMNKHFCTLAFPSSVDVKHVIQSIRDFSCGRSCDSPQMVIYIMLNDDKDLTSLMAVFNKNWKKQDLRIQPISRISLAVGELVDQKADVLVNSTNKMLNLDHGNVSKSLKASAGKKLQEECTKHAPVRCGEVITTGTGDLKMNKAIFHGVLQPCVKEHPECYQVMEEFIISCLRLVDEKGYKTIAFPVLGTGNLLFKPESVVKIMFNAVEKYFYGNRFTSVEQVVFVLYPKDKTAIEIFQSEKIQRSFGIGNFLKKEDPHERTAVVPVRDVSVQILVSDLAKCQRLSDKFSILCLWDPEDLKNPDKHPIVKLLDLEKNVLNTCVNKLKKEDFVVTTCDRVPALNLVHVVYRDLKPSAVRKAIEKGITEADKLQISIIIIPLHGILSAHKKDACYLMLKAFKTANRNRPIAVLILVKTKNTLNTLKKHFEHHLDSFSKNQSYFRFWSSDERELKEFSTQDEDPEDDFEEIPVVRFVIKGKDQNQAENAKQEIFKSLTEWLRKENQSSVVSEKSAYNSGEQEKQHTDENEDFNHQADINPTILRRQGHDRLLEKLKTMDGVKVMKCEMSNPPAFTVKAKTFTLLTEVYKIIDSLQNSDVAHRLSYQMGEGARPKHPQQYSSLKMNANQSQEIVIDSCHYEAVKKIIKKHLLEKYCITETVNDKVKLSLQISSNPDESKQLYHQIEGMIRFDIDISPSDSEKAKQAENKLTEEFSDVFCKYCYDKLVIIGDKRDRTNEAKNKAYIYLNKIKPTKRSNRQFSTKTKDANENSTSLSASLSAASKVKAGNETINQQNTKQLSPKSDISAVSTKHRPDVRFNEPLKMSNNTSEATTTSVKVPDILIYCDNILHSNAQAIVCWHYTDLSEKHSVPNNISEVAGNEYRKALKAYSVNQFSIGHIFKTTEGKLQKTVIHAVVSLKNELKEIANLKEIISKIFAFANTQELSSVAFPVLMTQKDVCLKDYTKMIFEAVEEFAAKESNLFLKQVQIVDKNQIHVQTMQDNYEQFKKLHFSNALYKPESRENKNVCSSCKQQDSSLAVFQKCKHLLCQTCRNKFSSVCPVCSSVNKPVGGSMPKGQMSSNICGFHLQGYPDDQTISINYSFTGGTQLEGHPNPGKRYYSTIKTAYLPNNEEGRTVYKLLKIAFERGLTFIIGADNTIDWSDIEHKTNTWRGPENNGYPDPDYLKRVREQLARKGITNETSV